MINTYVKRQDKDILDVFGKPFTLQGVGIGGWLLIEGYMIGSYKEIDRPRRLEEFIEKHTSKSYMNDFMRKWRQQYFTKQDIDYIKSQGFNSIRIPIDYQFLFIASETKTNLKQIVYNFELLEDIVAYCEKIGMYVILDLHAAPGGQTGTNIDNSSNNSPELFESDLYRSQFLYVWKIIATRFKKYKCVAAYDLLNEPLPNWQSKYNDLLVPLYKDAIQTIREVDPYHMITLEGLHWSTDLSCFTERMDENILLQFHKYWSNPDKESIQEYLDLRENLQVPLIMGEGGENNNKWYSSVFKLYDQLNISYNFWAYKKIDNKNSLVSFKRPKNWVDFLVGNLSRIEAEQVLDKVIENISFEQCLYNQDVVNHIQRKNHFTMSATGFDFYGEGISSYTIERCESSFRKSDNVRIATNENKIVVPNFKQFGGENQSSEDELYVYLKKNEWVKYTFDVTDINYVGSILLPNVDKSKVEIRVNDQIITYTNQGYIYINDREKNILKVQALDDVKIKEIIFR
jgi:hypothetical protein